MNAPIPENSPRQSGPRISRRALLLGGTALASVAGTLGLANFALGRKKPVFIARDQTYDGPLERTIRDGLLATGLDPALLRGKRILLKPNLVEPSRASPQLSTHPALVVAANAVFRSWGARVVVGEAPGHLRDTELALEESGLGEALESERVEFGDLNYQDVRWVPNAGHASPLSGLYFPRDVAQADLIVSMPKLKTHHWVGMTVSLKNMYGTLPGIKYGWPKNVLHHAGIPQTVFDINASLPPTLAIVDGILCMEGDGPIMGSPKPMGLVIIGMNPTAVDATCARIMGLDPSRVSYLQLAEGRLGPLSESLIPQRGEAWRALASPFSMLDVPHLRSLRAELTS